MGNFRIGTIHAHFGLFFLAFGVLTVSEDRSRWSRRLAWGLHRSHRVEQAGARGARLVPVSLSVAGVLDRGNQLLVHLATGAHYAEVHGDENDCAVSALEIAARIWP